MACITNPVPEHPEERAVVERADGLEVVPDCLQEGLIAVEVVERVVDDVVIDDVPVGMGQDVPEPRSLRPLFGQGAGEHTHLTERAHRLRITGWQLPTLVFDELFCNIDGTFGHVYEAWLDDIRRIRVGLVVLAADVLLAGEYTQTLFDCFDSGQNPVEAVRTALSRLSSVVLYIARGWHSRITHVEVLVDSVEGFIEPFAR